jgi:quercetin dioxygenase-like cupin family protein
MLRTIALVIIVAAFGSGVANAQQKVEVKGQSTKVKLNQVVSGYLSDLNGKYSLRVTEATFEPGGSVGPHHHAGPGIRLITAGELALVQADGKTTTYKAGDYFFESGDVTTSARAAKDKPTVVLIFEILPASLSGGSGMPPK